MHGHGQRGWRIGEGQNGGCLEKRVGCKDYYRGVRDIILFIIGVIGVEVTFSGML